MLGSLAAYEILLMLDPEAAEERQGEIVARVRDLVERGGGTWRSHDSWGRRRLAFEINHKTDAHYHLVVFETGAETLDEITRVLKIDDSVMRHLATKHIEGSSTRAPREETPAPAHAPREEAPPYEAEPIAEAEPPAEDEPLAEAEPAAVPAAEYAESNTRSDEE